MEIYASFHYLYNTVNFLKSSWSTKISFLSTRTGLISSLRFFTTNNNLHLYYFITDHKQVRVNCLVDHINLNQY